MNWRDILSITCAAQKTHYTFEEAALMLMSYHAITHVNSHCSGWCRI